LARICYIEMRGSGDSISAYIHYFEFAISIKGCELA
jgi:hypothetical protein